MNDDPPPVALVAMFEVEPNGRMDLFSLTVFRSEIGYDRRPQVARIEYNVDLSKKFGYIFNKHGFGGDRSVEVEGVYFAYGDVELIEGPTTLVSETDSPPWISPATFAIRECNQTRRLKRLPRRFGGHGRNLLAWLESNGIEEYAVLCATCRDFMPSTELCEHCWWCEAISWYSTPQDGCGCADRRICDGEVLPTPAPEDVIEEVGRGE